MKDFPFTMEMAPLGQVSKQGCATQPRHMLLTSYLLDSHAEHAEGITCINVAGLHAIGKVDGTIFRAEGKSHGQTDTFACNSSFTIDAFAVFRAFLYNIVGNGFDIMDH